MFSARTRKISICSGVIALTPGGCSLPAFAGLDLGMAGQIGKGNGAVGAGDPHGSRGDFHVAHGGFQRVGS